MTPENTRNELTANHDQRLAGIAKTLYEGMLERNTKVHIVVRCWMLDRAENLKYQMMEDFVCGYADPGVNNTLQLNLSPGACGQVLFEEDGIRLDTAFNRRRRTIFIPYQAIIYFLGFKQEIQPYALPTGSDWATGTVELHTFVGDDNRYRTDMGPATREQILQYRHWPHRGQADVPPKRDAKVLSFPLGNRK